MLRVRMRFRAGELRVPLRERLVPLWNLTTVPFGCFAAPLGYENPTYVSLKRDVAMILVDERKSTVACYGGTSKAKTPCCLCRRVF